MKYNCMPNMMKCQRNGKHYGASYTHYGASYAFHYCIQQGFNKCTLMQTDISYAPHISYAGLGNPLWDFSPHGHLCHDQDV